jgi:hypothetical protein
MVLETSFAIFLRRGAMVAPGDKCVYTSAFKSLPPAAAEAEGKMLGVELFSFGGSQLAGLGVPPLIEPVHGSSPAEIPLSPQ